MTKPTYNPAHSWPVGQNWKRERSLMNRKESSSSMRNTPDTSNESDGGLSAKNINANSKVKHSLAATKEHGLSLLLVKAKIDI